MALAVLTADAGLYFKTVVHFVLFADGVSVKW